jgi:hypothetical protein
MNTTDLRDTLARHAEFPDHDVAARPASVRGRIRVVRRRRAAAGAGAVAALVLGGFGLTGLADGGDGAAPASTRIGAVEAPRELQSLGYTFTFVHGVAAGPEAETGELVARGTIPETGKAHLLSWGTEADGAARVFARVERLPNLDAVGDDFTRWIVVPPGMEGDFVVRGADAAAVYELSQPAPGVSGHGVTFREVVGSYELAGAEFGETGESQVALEIAPGAGRLSSFGRFCESSVPGAQYQLLLGSEFVIGGACDGPAFDPGTIDNSSIVDPGAAGVVTMRLLQKGVDPATTDPAATLDDPDAKLGLAYYQAHEGPVDVLGADLDRTIEYAGHTWHFVRSVPADEADTVRLDSIRSPQLLTVLTRFDENVSLRFETGESVTQTSIAPGGRITGPVLWPDEEQLVISPWVGHPVAGTLAVAVYEQVD